MVNMTIYSSLVVTFSMLMLFFGTANLTIFLETNGYSNIVVAISEDIPQPGDGGAGLVDDLKELLTETSAILYKATNDRFYFKDIAILIPSTWTSDIPAAVTSTLSYKLADIRLTNEPVNSASGSLPYTLHSGKCGVAGNFITLPSDYLEDLTANLKVQAKGLVQQWAQLRYGVFEEHGYPNDELLPYFYRHPDGYDAVTSSNDTEIKGNLEKLSGGNCEVSANGIISDQGNCRFIPTATEQTATTSLMSFHWLDTVIGFSGKDEHDRRPPHRQNRLCNSRSSAEVMANLPDFNNVAPTPGLNTIPTFRLLQNMMLPVVYVAMDTSTPSNSNNTNFQAQNVLKRGLTNLFFLLTSYPEVMVAYSTFENIDSGPEDSYLKEELPPRRIEDGYDALTDKVNNFVVTPNVASRDVSAVVRDAESRLRQYRDVGGSILYIVTSTDSVTNDTVIETDMAERLMQNNIKLMVAETGFDTSKALARFSVLSQGGYYFRPTWDSTFFTPINNEIDKICKSGLKTERRIITSQKDSISASRPWEGSFSVDETLGRNTTLALSLPKEGSFTLTVTSPTGDVLVLPNEPEVTNWNYRDSTVRVIWQKIENTAVVGKWNYQVVYDTASCSSCETEPEIHLQIGSSIRSITSPSLPKFQPWVSLTAGSDFVDLSEHPAVIQARFEYAGSQLGELTVTAEVVLDSIVEASIPLFDTGLIDSDISEDGIYSGMFYPEMNGNYTVNLYAVHGTSVKKGNRILSPDQSSYCCGSSLPRATLNHFQITAREAIAFEVRNAGTLAQEFLPSVSDIRAETYGIDENRVYTELKWTVPTNTKSQVVKYSEDYGQLLDNFDAASEATIVYGSINEVRAGTAIAVYASAPYTKAKSVYFLVQTTAINDKKSRSHIVWTESNPPENAFTTPGPSTQALSTTTQASTSPSTSSITSTSEAISTTSSTVTSASTTGSSSGSSTAEPSTTTDGSSITTPTDGTSITTSTVLTSTASTSTNATASTESASTTPSSTSSVSSTSTTPSSTSTVSSTSTTLSSTSTTVSSTSTTLSSTSTTPSSTSASTSTPTVSTTPVSTTLDPTTTASSTEAIATTTSVSSTSSSPLPSSVPSTSTETINTSDYTTSTVDSTSPVSSTTDDSVTVTLTTDASTVSSTTVDPGDGDGDGLTSAEIGYIVGGVVGGIVVLGAIAGGVMVYKKKHSGGGNSLPPSTSYNGRNGDSGAPSGRSAYSNTAYPPSTSYISSTGKENNRRQMESFDQETQNYDNLGITFEDEDICMTAM